VKVVSGVLGVGLILGGAIGRGQSTATPPAATATAPPTPANTRVPACPKAGLENTQTIYFNNVVQPSDGNEIQNAVRNMLPPDIKIFYTFNPNALIVCATPDLMALAQKIVHDLDRPRTTYRLTYTITEMDGGKRIGAPQRYALVLTAGQRSTVHLGSKVPIASGSFGGGDSAIAVQTQFQYVDVGISFDATLDEIVGGVRLKSKVDQSSVAPESTDARVVHQPVVRQATLEGMSMLTLNKPLALGSLDIPGSAAHMDVEVMVEAVK
jgi:hypothetical protein